MHSEGRAVTLQECPYNLKLLTTAQRHLVLRCIPCCITLRGRATLSASPLLQSKSPFGTVTFVSMEDGRWKMGDGRWVCKAVSAYVLMAKGL
mmetsp:Transcript_6505/g.19754  ORF Transcript_6505/g.19754 Transcript_6505/m.19754 type:complete len:92 (+) Transcript_6505:1364-1639(+)